MNNDQSVLLKAARNAESSGDLLGAFHAWEQLASETKRADFYCHAGRAAVELGRWADAQKSFEDALETDSRFPVAMLMMGSLFLSRTDGSEKNNAQIAISWLSRALEMERSAMGLSLMGAALCQVGERNRAKELYQEAIAIDSAYEEAYFNLAILFAEEGEDLQAERLLRKAIELDPSLIEAHGRLGSLLHKQGRYLEAEYEFRRCVEIDNSDYFSHVYLADALVAEGRKKDAEQEYRTAIGIRPEGAPAIRHFANFLESQSRKEEADELRSRLLHRGQSGHSSGSFN